MATMDIVQLRQDMRRHLAAVRELCQGLDAAEAARAPSGRWSPKEILSHLLGSDRGHIQLFQAYLDKDEPTLDLGGIQTHLSEARAAMSVGQLLDAIDREYEGIVSFAAGLSEEQLARKARIPALKDSPFGETPTLGALITGMCVMHPQFHVGHLREVLEESAQAQGA